MIDLRSDTTSLPSSAIRSSVGEACVGDDSFKEDKSVNRLQDYCRELFEVEEALFVTSGMLANRLAVLTQTSPGDEVITDYNYHINFFDSGATAALAGVVLNTVVTADGVLGVADIKKAVNSKPRYATFAQVKLISLENTISSHQGKVFPYEEMQRIRLFSATEHIKVHLDGARLFNAHIASAIPLARYAAEVDTLSVCFSKGLGAPFGSMLMGRSELMEKARRLRGWLGSGYHQIGFCAEAAYIALTRQMDRLREDHFLAKMLANKISILPELAVNPEAVSTNIIFIHTHDLKASAVEFLDKCSKKGLLLFPWLPYIVRAVIHRDIQEPHIHQAAKVILEVSQDFLKRKGRKEEDEVFN